MVLRTLILLAVLPSMILSGCNKISKNSFGILAPDSSSSILSGVEDQPLFIESLPKKDSIAERSSFALTNEKDLALSGHKIEGFIPSTGALTFVPAPNFNGPVDLRFEEVVGQDVKGSPSTLQINFKPVDDSLLITEDNVAINVLETTLSSPGNGAFQEKALDFSLLTITSVDHPIDEIIVSLKSMPVAGFIVLNGVEINAGATFTIGDVKAGKVKYKQMGITAADWSRLPLSMQYDSVKDEVLLNSLSLNTDHALFELKSGASGEPVSIRLDVQITRQDDPLATTPVVRIASPALNFSTQGALTLQGTCTVGVDVSASVEIEEINAVSTPISKLTVPCMGGNFSGNITLLGADGNKNIQVKQLNNLGVVGTDARLFIKDVSPPSPATSLTWLPGGPLVNISMLAAQWMKSVDGLKSQSIQFFASAGCASGAQTPIPGLLASATSQPFLAAGDGTYSFKVISVDMADNTSTSSCSPNITVDRTAPVGASNLSWLPFDYLINKLTAQWTKSTDTLASQSLQLFALSGCVGVPTQTVAPSTSATSQAFSGLANGTYSFKIISNDLAGNSTMSPCSPDGVVDYTVDSTPSVGPSVLSYLPVSGALTTRPSTITFTMSEPVKAASLSALDFSVSGCTTPPTVTPVAGAVNTVVLTLSGGACDIGNQLSVSFDVTKVTDKHDNAGVGSITGIYTIDATPGSGPTVLSVVPLSSVVTVIPLSITFNMSEPVKSTSVVASDFTVTGCNVLPSVNPITTGNSISLSLSGGSCLEGDQLTVSLNGASVTDIAGNAGSGSGATVLTFDSTPTAGPTILSVTPISGGVAAVPTLITFNMSEPVKPTSVLASDFIASGCSTQPTLSPTVSGSKITLALAGGNCLAGEQLSVSLDASKVTDIAGNNGSGSNSVAYYLDATPNSGPTLVGILPVAGASVALPPSVVFQMSENVLASSVVASDFTVSGCTTLPALAVSVSGKTISLGLSGQTCLNGQQLTLTLDVTKVTDSLGNPGSGVGSVVYTIDSTPLAGPTILSITPPSGAFNVVPATVTFKMSEPVATSSVDLGDFSLSGCTTVPGRSVSVVGDVITILLLGGNCVEGQVLLVSLNAANVTDISGRAGSGSSSVSFTIDPRFNYVWNFSTPSEYTVTGDVVIDAASGLAKVSAGTAYTLIDDSTTQFASGNFYSGKTGWSGTEYALQPTYLGNATPGEGLFDNVLNSGASIDQSWVQVKWAATRPFGKEFPDNGATETGYSFGNAIMATNSYLFHFNEANGNTFNDSARYQAKQRNLICNGACPSIVDQGVFGKAAQFGFNGNTMLSSKSDTSPINSFSAWIKTSPPPGADWTKDQILIDMGTGGTSYGLIVGLRPSGKIFLNLFGDDNVTCTAPLGSVDFKTDHNWHNIFYTTAGSGSKSSGNIYIDGVHACTAVATDRKIDIGAIDGGCLNIGNRNGSCGAPNSIAPALYTVTKFVGSIDELVVSESSLLFSGSSLPADQAREAFVRGQHKIKLTLTTCQDLSCSNQNGDTFSFSEANNQTFSPPVIDISQALQKSKTVKYSVEFTKTNPLITVDIVVPGLKSFELSSGSSGLVTPTLKQSYVSISDLNELLGAGHTGKVLYQLSPDNGSSWYFYNGITCGTMTAAVPPVEIDCWSKVTGSQLFSNESNSMTQIKVPGNFAWFAAKFPSGIFTFRAMLSVIGSGQEAKLDSVTLTGKK
jgi:hypothetical protein